MNILIADSGSTKTDWCFIRNGNAGEVFQTPGLNPYFLDKSLIELLIEKEISPYIYINQVDKLFFYGAGLGSQINKQFLYEVFNKTFAEADIIMETDILGAAISLFGNQKGIAAILGTGSNSCYYNNGIISKQYPSFGYIIGDEGSGTYLGKLLVRSILSGDLPDKLSLSLSTQFNTDRTHILDKIYRQKNANIELSSYVPFIAENIEHPFINDLVEKSFSDFFSSHASMKNDEYKEEWRFTGSIASIFATQLRNSAKNYALRIGQITKSPIEGLIKYHLQAF